MSNKEKDILSDLFEEYWEEVTTSVQENSDEDNWLNEFSKDESDSVMQKQDMDDLFAGLDDDPSNDEEIEREFSKKNVFEDEEDDEEIFGLWDDEEESEDNAENSDFEETKERIKEEDNTNDEEYEEDDEAEEDFEEGQENEQDNEQEEKEEEDRKLKKIIEEEERQNIGDLSTIVWLTEWYITKAEADYQYNATNKVPVRPNTWYDITKHLTNQKKKNPKPLMTQDMARNYASLKKLLNMLTREDVDMFSKKKIESDEFKNMKLTDFRTVDIRMKKLPFACAIDCNSLSLKDYRDIDKAECANLLIDVLYTDEEQREKGIKKKTEFFRRWWLYVLIKNAVPDDHYYDLTTKMIDNWDYSTILLGYDVLNNKPMFQKIPKLIHYQVIGGTGSGKSVTMMGAILQYLAKNNTEALIIEKGTDFINLHAKAKKLIFRHQVDLISFEDMIAVFTYLAINISLRSKMLGKCANIEEYNKLREKEWKSKMGYMLFVIDEFLVLRGNLKQKNCEDFFLAQLANIVAKARSYGIYLMLITQWPTTEQIPTIIQNNLMVKLTAATDQASSIKYFKNSADSRQISLSKSITLWDFIISMDEGETINRSYFDTNNCIDKLIENNYLLWRTVDEQTDIEAAGWPSQYSTKMLNQKIFDMIWAIGCNLTSTERFAKYGIRLEQIEAIDNIQRIAVIVLINFLLDWFESTADTLRDTNITPTVFNIKTTIDLAVGRPENEALKFVFVLIQNLFDNHIKDGIKNIKFSKADMKGISGDDASSEGLDTFISHIIETIIFYVQKMLQHISPL